MKVTKFVNLMAVGMALTLVSSGCKHAPQGVTHIPNRAPERGPNDFNVPPINPGEGPTGGKFGEGTGPTPQPNPGDIANYTRNTEIFKSDTVYFAYDSSAIKSAEQSKIANVANHLKSNPSNYVEVDGHCDERGTDEYNRALGERRALAIREALIALGADGGKVTTVSFGRDKPVDLGHSEAAHAKNRRGEFILLTPP
jgi:peptidoglycan-associated lipoprotein